ncbi:hypothetical protein [Alkaliphilus metalliredigens]|uniref:hypothetical protein n=1 Tax=Alkaliphilus metalliredigens TaxID=208226 RepID=UPI00059F39DA|nr:hypothetical protein [Alkaliphilus metalliredigens]
MKNEVIKCPNCHDTTIGKISKATYFCSNCCSEIVYRKDEVYVYKHNEDGRMIDNLKLRGFEY